MSERFSVGEISHLSKISSMPLCKACPGSGGMVKVSCSCGHVFITKRSKPCLTAKSGSRKHTMSSFRALETDEQAADRMSVDRACKAKKRVLEPKRKLWNASHMTELVKPRKEPWKPKRKLLNASHMTELLKATINTM